MATNVFYIITFSNERISKGEIATKVFYLGKLGTNVFYLK